MLSKFSVHRPYTVIVAIIIIVILGIISVSNITTDLLPSINLPYALVVTAYPGANPEAVESTISRPIEQSMLTLNNIKNVESISSGNFSLVILEFNETTNMDSAMIELRENLDLITSVMPNEVISPMIMRINPDMLPVSVVTVAVEDQSLVELSHFINEIIVPEYESLTGVASVSAVGLVDQAVHVTLDQERIDFHKNQLEQEISSALMFQSLFMPNLDLQQLMKDNDLNLDQLQDLQITKEMVSLIIQGQNYSMPAGYILEDNTPYLVRIGDKIQGLDELRNLPIFSLPFPNFNPITLSDIADVELLDSTEQNYAKVNGIDAVVLTMQKQTDYSTADVANRIREHSNQLIDQYEGLSITTLMDQGEYIDDVITSIVDNIIYGGLLALIILLIFLRDLKPTIVVGFSIPISIITTFVLMYFSGITLNIISMGGLALGVGMLIDNSIVVIENIFRMRSNGKSPKDAAIEGAKQVSGAITTSTITTVAVFIPFIFTQGLLRQVFSDMGLTIAYSLGTSLIIALTLVPMVAARLLNNDPPVKNQQTWLKTNYSRILEKSMNKKGLVISSVVILFGLSTITILSMGTEFFPSPNSNQILVEAQFPASTSFADVIDTADHITDIIGKLESVDTVGAFLGNSLLNMGVGIDIGTSNHESLSVYVLLDENRRITSSQVAQQIREKTAHLDLDLKINESNIDLTALTGGSIVLNITGQDIELLQTVAKDIAQIVDSVAGTVEVSDGLADTAPEIQVLVNKEKSISHGLTVGQVLLEVNQKLNSSSSVTSVAIGTNQYQIYIHDEHDKQSNDIEALKILTIESPFGEPVMLSEIASITEAQGFSTITRKNQQRYVTVSADIADGYNVGNISQAINQELVNYQLPPGVTIDVGGEQFIILESFDDLTLILVIGLILIYLTMVAQFQSLLSPFIVMLTIPLAFTGGFIGLIVTGNPLSIVALLGLIVLSGIVVNNGIVFVDYINILRNTGINKREAIIQAGVVRLRPILMTALTTILGLSTMALGVGTGTEMIQPMAISAVSGLIYATLLTLIVVPVFYDLFNRDK